MCIQQHHFDRNRKAVQRGLDRRKEARAEAAQEAADLAFLDELRRNTQRRETAKVAAEAAVCRHVDQVVEETNREIEQQKAQLHQEQYRRDRKALAEKQLRTCCFLTFFPLILAAVIIRLHDMGMVPLWVTLAWAVFACIYSLWNFVAYATRNVKHREVKHHG